MSKFRTPCAERNDGLGWVAGSSHRFHNLTIGLRTSDARFLPRLHEALPGGCQASSERQVDHLFSFKGGGAGHRKGVRHFHVAFRDWTRIARTLDLESALATLHDTVSLAIVTAAENHLFLTACQLNWRGRSLILAGLPGPEREALSEALVAAGAQLYSSRFVEVDPKRGALNYHRVEHPPLRPGWVLVPADDPVQQVLTPGGLALHLFRSAPAGHGRPDEVMQKLARFCVESEGYLGSWRDPALVVDFVKRLSHEGSEQCIASCLD